jgi:hypothetical protein
MLLGLLLDGGYQSRLQLFVTEVGKTALSSNLCVLLRDWPDGPYEGTKGIKA